jgi:hypothetical protein
LLGPDIIDDDERARLGRIEAAGERGGALVVKD